MAQSREERLRKKREAEKRRYERLKNDAQGREYLKDKEKNQYNNKKRQKIIVPIDSLSERAKRSKRKEWRVKKRDYRIRKQRIAKEQELLEEQTPPVSDYEEDNNVSVSDSYKKKAASMRKKKSREMKDKDHKIAKLKKKVEKYKKRYQREKLKRNRDKDGSDSNATPRTRVRHLLQDENKKREVARKLLFAESLSDQLDESLNSLKSQEEKRHLKKMLSGKIMKKNRLLTSYKRKLRINKQIVEENKKSCMRKPRKDKIYMRELKKVVHSFYLEDSSSRVMPGKKDCITKGKIKMQKRFLNSSKKHLYREFLRTYPEKAISYVTFCRCKPFWVKHMNVSSRDTCKCIHCANMELLTQSLSRIGLVECSTLESLKQQFCCDSRSEECLFRECKKCPPLKIAKDIPTNLSQTKYYKWVTVTETFFNKKTQSEKVSKKITKKQIICEPKKLVETFEANISSYLSHEGRKIHQYRAIRDLKKQIKTTEAIIQMDFSENYETKFSEEVQAYHFGGSRQQITLHTVVVHVLEKDEIKNVNFCTLSESLKHDVPAIWAHLNPVLNYLKENHKINVIHFVSDGPSTQYRNKSMFCFLGTNLKTIYPDLKSFTWNYLEAGHGKGAPDGIGGVSKRTADRAVAEGKDVSNIQELASTLQEKVKGVHYFIVSEAEVQSFSNLINLDNVKPLKGTMQVHQIWNEDISSGILEFRKISFFDSNSHLKLGSLSFKNEGKL